MYLIDDICLLLKTVQVSFIIVFNNYLIYDLSLPSLTGTFYHPSTTTITSSTTQSTTSNTFTENGQPSQQQQRARVVCNYEARDPSELSVLQDEVTKFEI